MKKSRAILGAVLGLALTVPLSPLTAEAAGGRWEQVDLKTRRYFVPDGQVEKQRTVLSTSEKLVSTTPQTQRGAHIKAGADPVGAVTTRDALAPAKDRVTIVPGAAEAIGNDWVEYEIVKREKATERFYSQQENKYDLYVEQSRSAQTYQVTDQVRLTETWTDPVTKQTQQTVTNTNETRNEIRYTAWTDTAKQIRVDAGTSTRTWGPDLIFAKVPDEQRVAKRSSLTPPGGLAAGWWLFDTETFRYFLAGNTPPSDAKQATEAKGNEIREGTGPALGGANSDWVLVNLQNVRDFVKGSTPPAGGVAATPEQRAAMLNPVDSGWILANSELIRYFVMGDTPPKDAQQANPEQKAAMDAGVTNDWYLVNVENLRTFLAGNVPPQDAVRSKDPANADPIASGDWWLNHVNSFRFFVAIPGNFENPIPARPVDPARELISQETVQHPDKATTLDDTADVKSWREGLLIKRTYPRYRFTPQTLVKTFQHWAQQLETYTTYENREIAVNLGGGNEMMTFQVPVKNYKWVPAKTHQTKEYTALEDLKTKIADVSLPDLRASEVSSLAVANGERPTSFQGDSGSGGKAALAAAKQREQMGANKVTASNIPLSPEQIEAARRAAEEQARQQLEEENRRKAEEEAQRKAEREAQARAEQARKAAEEAAEAAALAAAEAAQKAAEQANSSTKEQIVLTAYQAAQKAIADSRQAIGSSFTSELSKVVGMLDPFKLAKDKNPLKDILKKQQDLLDDYNKELEKLQADFEKKAKGTKDLVELAKVQQEFQKKLNSLKADMDKDIQKMNKDVGSAVLKHVDQGGTMRTGEQANINGQSVMAYYSHDTGRWILFGYPDKNYKGDPVILGTGVNPRLNSKDTPIIPSFTYNGVKMEFKVDYTSYWPFGSVYDATINKIK